ncbi:GntR family transcriptional regulator [Wolinella succinogenes]|uniref:GntR family transcriptional regulator n=1 Tax=Wolinella succinogenes TaxID=844 RepID=UPI000304513E|nr:GntR family transcriptional regulator [Wolinella succinogenes]NLU35082.1 GntR family transcriptional regulator [Wolinella succinogenes]VEG80722.1 Uncharacterized HTH-type transcriptional regulator ydfH [Wolinella succinogenes]HCZ18745.1 GntR family transcriptional regulator [Helicobacter sp.]
MTLLKKVRMLPAREQVASILRSSILSGEIAQGESITLDGIGEQVGMSRTPVREAFQILASEGLLELRPNRCAIVKGISPDTIRDHYELRMILETEALKRACERMTSEDLASLEEINQQGKLAKARGDVSTYNLINQAFHMVIWTAAGSEKLKHFLSLLWNGLSMNKRITAQEYATTSQDEHSEILEKILQKDSQGACHLMREHIRHSMESMLMNFHKEDEARS